MTREQVHLFEMSTGGLKISENVIKFKQGTMKVMALFLLLLFLSGCVTLPDPEVAQEYHSDVIGIVSPGHPMGQTFTARRQDVNGITLWLRTESPSPFMTVQVLPSPAGGTPYFSSTFQILDGENHFKFDPPLPDQSFPFYIELRVSRGEIAVFGRDEDVYAHGDAIANHQPIVADLGFRTTYEYSWRSVLTDLGTLGMQGFPILIMFLLLFLPGWLILDMFQLRKNFDSGEQLALSVGISLAIIPLVMVWTTTLKLPWSRSVLWVAFGAMTATFFWRWIIRRNSPSIKSVAQWIFKPDSHFLVLIGIFLLSFFLRFAMVRDLAAPPWVDSIHHALITEGIVQAGGYPQNYLPHIPIEVRYYHPGYHSILASFYWLSRLEIPQAMLLLGQGLNALTIFAVYILTTTLTKDKTAALGAAMITGLFSAMPAYYTSWGRYTQLTGLLILPAALALLVKIPAREKKLPQLTTAALCLGGLIMVHYRAAFFTACLLVAIWIGKFFRREIGAWGEVRALVLRTALAAILAAALIAPWVLPTFSNFLLPSANRWGRGNPAIPAIHWRYFTEGAGTTVLVVAGLGLVLGILKRRRFTITLLVWGLLLFLAANPATFHLPFPTAFINQTSVEIMLFLPISVLGGYFISEVFNGLGSLVEANHRPIWWGILAIIGLEAAMLGAIHLLPVLNPETFLFRQDDHNAITWIEENLSEDETVVINPTGWGYGLYRGQDGGYWISPITNLATMPPNVLYGFNQAQKILVNDFVEALLPIGEDPQAIWSLLRQYGYKVIYIGARGGVLSAKALEESSLFQVRYHQGRTWVFEAVGIP